MRFLGRGGMGDFNEAEDTERRERVALETIPPGTVARYSMIRCGADSPVAKSRRGNRTSASQSRTP